jgi:hypothetical protein
MSDLLRTSYSRTPQMQNVKQSAQSVSMTSTPKELRCSLVWAAVFSVALRKGVQATTSMKWNGVKTI